MPGPYIPAPSARDLLPPLLACLASANSSKDTPPALFPLLSPILRQRVQLLASDSWLPLLSWDNQAANKLQDIISKLHIEPHPSSGEIEVEEPENILYRRSDPETLHARLALEEFGIIPTYLWCTGGEGGSGWKLSDLRGLQDREDGTEWFLSMFEANEKGLCRKSNITNTTTTKQAPAVALQSATPEEEEEDDDAYWAAYDRTPGRTPLTKRSPAPGAHSAVQPPTTSELDYFGRYAEEVQPALDAHDPDEEMPGPGESTLNGNALSFSQAGSVQGLSQFPSPEIAEPITTNGVNGHAYTNGDSMRWDSPALHSDNGAEHIENIDEMRQAVLSQPRPASAASSNSVSRLEREAESHSHAELAIKQHISTHMKSLFRLARNAGIEREEFESIVLRELEVLELLELDR